MQELLGRDVWSVSTFQDWICVPTNGTVNRMGLAVMGAGVAKQAAQLHPNLKSELAHRLYVGGNMVYTFCHYRPCIVTFPVKHIWQAKADIGLIVKSAETLMTLLDLDMNKYVKKVWLPKPGCGNGQLSWGDVKPMIEPILTDRRVIVVDVNG